MTKCWVIPCNGPTSHPGGSGEGVVKLSHWTLLHHFSLHSGVWMGTSDILLGSNPVLDQHPIQGGGGEGVIKLTPWTLLHHISLNPGTWMGIGDILLGVALQQTNVLSRGGLRTLLGDSCYRNWVKLWLCDPLWLMYALAYLNRRL